MSIEFPDLLIAAMGEVVDSDYSILLCSNDSHFFDGLELTLTVDDYLVLLHCLLLGLDSLPYFAGAVSLGLSRAWTKEISLFLSWRRNPFLNSNTDHIKYIKRKRLNKHQ